MRIFLLTLFLLKVVSCFGQQNGDTEEMLRGFVHNIQIFNNLYPQEKVWLHIDNTGYYLGETIWFKAYSVTASKLLPDTMSNILYVELLNPMGKVLETKKLKIQGRQCHGGFDLSLFNYDYCAGFYEIRAYTKWMLNFGRDIIFSRVLPVFNSPYTDGDYGSANMQNSHEKEGFFLDTYRKKPAKLKELNVNFFPEGGNLIKGLSSVVAFKATSENGTSVDVKGWVCNPKGETISEFSCMHAGMGSFYYVPDGSKNRVKFEYDGQKYLFDLPGYLESGYVLSINNMAANYLEIKIKKSTVLPSALLGLSVMCRGEVLYFQTMETSEDSILLQIPKKVLMPGVNHLTLFDAKGEIYAERMIFIPVSESEKVTITTKAEKEHYKSRERININISASQQVNLSFVVRDAALTIENPNIGNIMTYFLLSSDLKGFIEDPAYYFGGNGANRYKKLDLLMMVQGWRRYEWKSMAGVEPISFNFDAEKRLKIKGKIIGKADSVKIWLGSGDLFMEGTFPVNSMGSFSTYIDDIAGRWDMSLRAGKLAKANLNIRLDRWFSPAPRDYHLPELQVGNVRYIEDSPEDLSKTQKIDLVDNKELLGDSLSYFYELSQVEIEDKRGKEFIYDVEREYERWVDLGMNNIKYLVFDYLVSKNNGFIFHSKDPDVPFDNSWFQSAGGCLCFGVYHFKLGYIDANKKIKYRDGLMHNDDDLFSIERALNEVKKIVVFPWKKRYPGQNSCCTSGFSIPAIIYPQESAYARNIEDLRFTYYDGYSSVKDFYQNKPQRENYIPDRTEHIRTLYWNPNVRTDAQGNAKISFYNNHYSRDIEIKAEGITTGGIPFSN